MNWFLSGEFRWSLYKLKHQYMKQVFHKIYLNLAKLTGDESGKKLCVYVCKTTVFSNEELRPFLETTKLILSYIYTIDIGLKQRRMKKLKQYAYYHKINSLVEKTTTTKKKKKKKKTNNSLCVFKSFQHVYVY